MMKPLRAALLSIAQFAGGIAASALVYGLLPGSSCFFFSHNLCSASLLEPLLAGGFDVRTTLSANCSVVRGVFIEIFLTAIVSSPFLEVPPILGLTGSVFVSPQLMLTMFVYFSPHSLFGCSADIPLLAASSLPSKRTKHPPSLLSESVSPSSVLNSLASSTLGEGKSIFSLLPSPQRTYLRVLCSFSHLSLNPARSLGPAVVSGAFSSYFWIYIVAPSVGAALAAGLYRLFKCVFLSLPYSSNV